MHGASNHKKTRETSFLLLKQNVHCKKACFTSTCTQTSCWHIDSSGMKNSPCHARTLFARTIEGPQRPQNSLARENRERHTLPYSRAEHLFSFPCFCESCVGFGVLCTNTISKFPWRWSLPSGTPPTHPHASIPFPSLSSSFAPHTGALTRPFTHASVIPRFWHRVG